MEYNANFKSQPGVHLLPLVSLQSLYDVPAMEEKGILPRSGAPVGSTHFQLEYYCPLHKRGIILFLLS